MKTSTKNALITGIFSIIAAGIGTLSFSIGKTTQNEKIETTINQSGVITISQNESSSEVIERLLNEYVQLQSDYNSVSVKYADLENDYNTIENEKNTLAERVKVLESENNSLSNTLTVQKSIEESAEPEIKPTKYLFDEDPYMVDYVKLYMRNNDRNTIYSKDGFYYDTGFRMSSNNIEYQKGMAITPNAYEQSSLYYNLEKKFLLLSGSIAFEDKFSDRIDKNYNIYIYADDNLIETISISKGELPKDFNIDITNCSILRIMLERPEGDRSDNPNINLIEWKLYS